MVNIGYLISYAKVVVLYKKNFRKNVRKLCFYTIVDVSVR